MRSIGWVAEVLDAPIHRPDRTRSLTGVAIDSRTIQPGELFVALPGERTDGHQFLEAAFRQGASAALVRDVPTETDLELVNCIRVPDPLEALQQLAAHRRAELTIPIVGITGSTGKTTTKELLQAVLSERYGSYRTPGNRNTEIGLPLALLNMPDAADVGVVEMGLQHPGDIQTLVDIARPSLGVLTSIGDAHIGHFDDQAALAREKWALIASLPPQGHAVLNLDTPFVDEWREELTCRQTTFGIERTDADVGIVDIEDTTLKGLTVHAALHGDEVPLPTALHGRHNAYAVLAALAVGRALDVPIEAIQRAIAGFSPIPHRMELKRSARYGLILDDTYNASPSATLAALHTLARLSPGQRKIAILGDMRELGERAHAQHAELAAHIDELGIDGVLTIGELARRLSDTLRDEYGWPPERAAHAADVEQIQRELARRLPQRRALILVKGSRAMALDELVDRLVTPTTEAPRRSETR